MEMKVQKRKLICSVMGCRSTDTYFLAKNGVMVNTPNMCKDCVRAAFEALFPEEAEKLNAVDEAVDEMVDETENAVDEETDEPKK